MSVSYTHLTHRTKCVFIQLINMQNSTLHSRLSANRFGVRLVLNYTCARSQRQDAVSFIIDENERNTLEFTLFGSLAEMCANPKTEICDTVKLIKNTTMMISVSYWLSLNTYSVTPVS